MLLDKIKETSDFLKSKCRYSPSIGIVLGSGLGSFADNLKDCIVFDYKDIINFPKSTVEGHKGRLLINKDIICMDGRFHFYEGFDMKDLSFPIRVMKMLGVKYLIITNAVGGINETYSVGETVLIKDHINFMGTNPLIGKNYDDIGERFPDLSDVYSKEIRNKIKSELHAFNIDIKEGVYMAFTGPSYETPSEIKMAKILDADVVGMSCVPEAIAAAHAKIKVVAFSLVTNLAAGLSNNILNHKEVIENANKSKDKLTFILEKTIEVLLKSEE